MNTTTRVTEPISFINFAGGKRQICELFRFVVALSAGLPATCILVNVLLSVLGCCVLGDDAVTANAP